MATKKIKYPAPGTNDYRLTGIDCVTLSPAAFSVGLRTVAGGHVLTFGAYNPATRQLTVSTGDPGKVGVGSVLILWTCAIDANSPYRVTVIAVDQDNKTLTLGADLPVTALHIARIAEWVGAVRDLTSDDSALASGEQSLALGRNSFASGTLSIATGRGAHAEGVYCEARGDMSFAAGSGSIAAGDGAFALGENVKAAAKKSVVIGSDGELADTPDNTGALAIVCDGAAMLKIFANKSVRNPLYPAAGEPEYIPSADRGLQYAGHLLPVTVTITDGSALVLDHGVAARWKVTPTEAMTPTLANWRDGDRGELVVRNGNGKINFPSNWIWIGTQPALKTDGVDIFPLLQIDDEIYIYGEAAASGGGGSGGDESGLVFYLPLNAAATNAETGQTLVTAGSVTYTPWQGIPCARFYNGSIHTVEKIGISGNGSRSISFWAASETGFSIINTVGMGDYSDGQRDGCLFNCGARKDWSTLWDEFTNYGTNLNEIRQGESDGIRPFHHYCFVYNEATPENLHVYLDGVLKTYTITQVNTPDSPVWIGSSGGEPTNSDYQYKGYLASVRVYNRALTQTEITALAAEHAV